MYHLSIITINYNNSKGLNKTLKSIANQSEKKIEHIIIDGGSDDDSLNIIKEYFSRNCKSINIKWTCESDNGIYDAMNKGIIQSTGRYILFLNSGDSFISYDTIKNCNLHKIEEDLVYGDIYLTDNSCNLKKLKKYNFPINFDFMLRGTLCHNATFIKAELFKRIGLYDLSYDLVSDWKFFMQVIFQCNGTLCYLDFPIIEYDIMGFSSLPQNQLKLNSERENILNEEFQFEMYMYKNGYVNIKQTNKKSIRFVYSNLLNLTSILKKIYKNCISL
jgi:glycosyltransferase involved in cell wall biosynthesis